MRYTIHKRVVGEFQENTWIIAKDDDKSAVIIDPGGQPEVLVNWLNDNGVHPVAILNTHGHLDHIGAVKSLQKVFKIPFYLHSKDEFLVDMYSEHARMFGVEMYGVPEVTHSLDSKKKLVIAGLTFTVLETPGHTPGGVSFLLDDHLFSGDTLFAGSIGRTDLPGGDYETLLNSIVDNLLPLPDDTKVHPGHGPDTTLGAERQANPFIRQWLQQATG